MGRKQKDLIIAFAITALDFVVASKSGVAVWRAYANVLPAQLLLLLFVAVWMTSLADLWRRVVRVREEAPHPRRIRLSDIPPSTTAKVEASDV